ncbi:heme oxygenase (staphylobilin-producing) [Paenibacillus sp. DS2015]|uniref:antibiotic biosynthesis monooxygenase n=1 Tax=Paenibacillus sp. DS2015 TaxID=3373917 RepID=UPI003D20D603
MFVQNRTILVEKGNSDKVIARFSKEGPLDHMEGLIDISVMVNKKSKDNEEVVVVIRWESQEDWKNWEKSDAHIQGHRDKRGQESPAFIISTLVNMYESQIVKRGKAYANQ